MAESLLVDPGSFESMQTFQRMRRSHNVDTNFFRHYMLSPTDMFYPADFHHNPPNIDKFLKLNLRKKIKEFLHHADVIEILACNKQWDQIGNHTKALAEFISIDPRLISELDGTLMQLIIEYLVHEHKPKLQSQAVIILQHYISYSESEMKQLVAQEITDSIIVDLISSDDCELKMQALCLFRTVAPTMPQHEFRAALDVALKTLTLLVNDSTVDEELLCSVSMTLAIVCQVYPTLPLPQLELVLDALNKLFECSRVDLLTYACMALVYLCEGRKGIEFIKKISAHLVLRLIHFIRFYYEPKYRPRTIAALATLGTIVRWGDDDIVDLIVGATLPLLADLLALPDKQYLGNACRIISNITAGKENHIKAVIDFELIHHLFDVVQSYKLLDVKKEAAWAISNAMYGAGSDHREAFRKSCVIPLWNILKVFHADQEIISFCLEGLVIIEGVKVSYHGKPINAIELKKHLVTLRGGQFQSELKKPRDSIDNKRFEDCMEFCVTYTLNESACLPDLVIRLFYKSSEEDGSNMVDQVEVDEMEANSYLLF